MLRYALALLIPLALSGCGKPCGDLGEMCRVAGTGDRASIGDGMPALSTPLYWVSSVRKGLDGRVYLMEQNGYRLRAIQPDGTVTTIAGIGEHNGAVIGERADETPWLDPIDFAFRPDGRIVMVSWHDTRLLEIGLDGRVALVAGLGTGEALDPAAPCHGTGDGGPATDAGFCELTAIAIAGDGRIFVADDLANQVRVISPDGTIDTYAGNGNGDYSGDGGIARGATMRTPSALALDGEDNLYIADSGNHVIRRVNAQTRIIDTVVGNGRNGFSGDGGPCKDASMSYPGGVAAAADGTIYVSDTFNNRLRRVDLAADRVDTVAGDGNRGLSGDDGPAESAELYHPVRLSLSDGVLYVADMLNGVARTVRVQ
jgi:hypothetical protein